MLFKMIEWSQYTRASGSSISNERGWTEGLFAERSAWDLVSNSDEKTLAFNMALIEIDYSQFGV
jgi:hypothetical protein